MHMLDSDYGTMEVQKTWQAQESLDLVILMDNKKEYNLYISKTIICIPGWFNSAFLCILCENGGMNRSFWERQEFEGQSRHLTIYVLFILQQLSLQTKITEVLN